MKKVDKKTLFKYICLFLYVICVVVLIVEASMDGKASSNQSNTVGGVIADTFNDLSGDQTKAVIPTAISINNKITDAKIDTSHLLEIVTTPNDATYQSVYYTTSDPKVATVSGDGKIDFLSKGTVIITVTNQDYPELKDSITIEVSEIEATSISSSITTLRSIEEDIKLYMGHQYVIETVFTPSNTTNKNLTYQVSDPTFLTVSEDGIIIPKKYSARKTITIKVIHEELINEINVVVDYENKVELNTINIDIPGVSVGQTVTPKVTFVPSDATFKDYKLSSLNTDILKVSGTKLVGVSEGKAIVKIQSVTYPDIFKEVEVIVNPQPELDLNKTKVSMSSSLLVGSTTTIKITKYPTYAAHGVITYESQDTNIAIVSSKGVVTAVSVGSTKIIVTINSKEYILPIEVKDKLDTTTTGFALEQSEYEVSCGKEIDLDTLIKVVSWTPATPTNKKMVYELDDSTFGTISGNKLTLLKPGKTTITVIHKDSGIKQNINIFAIYDFEIVFDNDNVVTTLNVYSTLEFLVKDNQKENIYQEYHFEMDNNIGSIQIEGNNVEFTALSEGEITIKVIPFCENDEYITHAKEVKIVVQNIYTNSLSAQLIETETNDIILSDSNNYNLIMIDNYYLKTLLSNDTTIYNIIFSSSNNEVVEVTPDGKILFKTSGSAMITVKEEYSGLSYQLNINILNYIKLNEENSYTFKGNTLSFNEDENKYHIENGNSCKLKLNFVKDSTYTKVTYSSSNEKIAKVGQDGKITPLKSGDVVITVICDDGTLEPVILEVNLRIDRQNLINNLSDFFYKVRKGLGHFGAFLVLGIFSTFTWLLFFTKKKMFFSVPINIILGFGIAALTEIIQLYVPGRYGALSDVLLDFSGFILSAGIISIVFIIKDIVIFIRKKLI